MKTGGDWWEQAACAGLDADAWYPEKGSRADMAKRVCYRCPVQDDYLTWALDHDEKGGIWGGLAYNERLRLRLARGQVAA
jgi:WhiB family redox-sensing transcriptional regulator